MIAEIHVGGRHVWDGEVTAEPDPRAPGRALVRVRAPIDVATFARAQDPGGVAVGLYVNGHQASTSKARAEFDGTAPGQHALVAASVDVEAVLLVEEASLAPILSRSFGTNALNALLAALPRCARCVEERKHKESDPLHPPLLAVARDGADLVCLAHRTNGSAEPLPYEPVIRAIRARIEDMRFPWRAAADAPHEESR